MFFEKYMINLERRRTCLNMLLRLSAILQSRFAYSLCHTMIQIVSFTLYQMCANLTHKAREQEGG